MRNLGQHAVAALKKTSTEIMADPHPQDGRDRPLVRWLRPICSDLCAYPRSRKAIRVAYINAKQVLKGIRLAGIHRLAVMKSNPFGAAVAKCALLDNFWKILTQLQPYGDIV